MTFCNFLNTHIELVMKQMFTISDKHTFVKMQYLF
jgi:hypothetical protein